MTASIATLNDFIGFAKDRHGDQKYAGEPYRFHLARVAQKLSLHGFWQAVHQIIAWGHDLVEDTTTTVDEIRVRAGEEAAAGIWACTGVGPNRKARNQSIREKLAMYPQACIYKTADRLQNHETCMCDPSLGDQPSMKHLKTYLAEREEFETMVRPYIPSSMWQELQRQYEAMQRLVNQQENSSPNS